MKTKLDEFRANVSKLPPLKIPAKVAMIAEDLYGIKLNEGGGGYELTWTISDRGYRSDSREHDNDGRRGQRNRAIVRTRGE